MSTAALRTPASLGVALAAAAMAPCMAGVAMDRLGRSPGLRKDPGS